MYIESAVLANSISKIVAIASIDKSNPGILFDISDDGVEVYYNSGQKGCLDIIDNSHVEFEDNDIRGKVVFDYKKLVDILDSCSASKDLKVNNVRFQFTSNPNVCTISADKYMTMVVASDDETEETVDRKVSSYSMDIAWFTTEQLTTKQKILTTKLCDDMFNDDNSTVFDVATLKSILSEMTSGDAQIIYMTRKFNGFFASNTNHVVTIPYENDVNNDMVVPSASLKALVSALSYFSTEDIYVSSVIDEKTNNLVACLFFNESKTSSIYLTACKVSNTNLTRVKRFLDFEYNSHKVTMMTSVFANILQTVAKNSSVDAITIDFIKRHTEDEEDAISAEIKVSNTLTSSKNRYTFDVLSYWPSENLDDVESDKIFGVTISLKVLDEIIKKCKTSIISIEIGIMDDVTLLKIGFLDLGMFSDKLDSYMADRGMAPEDLTETDKANVRSMCITTSYYLSLKQS